MSAESNGRNSDRDGRGTAEEEKEIQRTYRVHHSVRNHHSGGYRHVVHPRRRLLEAGVPA